MKPSKLKTHITNATDMSFTDIVKGTAALTGNTISLGFKALGATVYVANKAVNAGLSVGQSAYNEVKEGYTQTDDILSSKQKPQATRKSEPTKAPTPEQMEFEFYKDLYPTPDVILETT